MSDSNVLSEVDDFSYCFLTPVLPSGTNMPSDREIFNLLIIYALCIIMIQMVFLIMWSFVSIDFLLLLLECLILLRDEASRRVAERVVNESFGFLFVMKCLCSAHFCTRTKTHLEK